MADYLPTREAELLTWCENFSDKISAAPGDYGLTLTDASDLASLVSAFTTTYGLANNPDTRTRVAVTQKDTAKHELLTLVRSLAQRIQANLSVTDTQRTSLGLPVRDKAPSPVPAPASKPLLELAQSDVMRHTIRIFDAVNPASRAKPAGAIGAQVFTYVATPGSGEAPPLDLEKWSLSGLATRSEYQVVYPVADAGKKAWIAARWFNEKGQAGPRSDAVTRLIAA